MLNIQKYTTQLLAVLTIFAAVNSASACTGIEFTTKMENGKTEYTFAGRTMEFGPDVTSWKLMYVPKDYLYKSCEVSGIPTCWLEIGKDSELPIIGSSWTVTYPYVGFAPMRPIKVQSAELEYTMKEVDDGINSEGLYCGGFYHMQMESYSTAPYSLKGQLNISDMDFVPWALGNFASVSDLKAALNDSLHVRQFEVPEKYLKNKDTQFPQLHFMAVDRTGDAIVVEFVDGKPKVFDSVGVITNKPTYDWHTVNLSNYVNLRTTNYESVKFLKHKYEKLSNGTGGLGLPGDFSSPSRFVRAAYMLNATLTNTKYGNDITTPEDAVLRSFRVLNQFDIPEGAVVEVHSENPPNATLEMTSWTSMADLHNLRYYYHTMNSRVIRMVSISDLIQRLPEGSPTTIELPSNEVIVDVTNQFKAK